MALTGYEKPLTEYSKKELVEIAKTYSVYYKTASGVGKISGYDRLTKETLINIIKSDDEYIYSNPKNPRIIGGKKVNRFKNFKESLLGTETPEELMDEILNLASNSSRTEIIPEKYYTYVYYAATPKILYDRHPLIKAVGPLDKGFVGFNYHLLGVVKGLPFRQYNTVDGDRLVSGLFELTYKEFETLRSIPYRRLIQN